MGATASVMKSDRIHYSKNIPKTLSSSKTHTLRTVKSEDSTTVVLSIDYEKDGMPSFSSQFTEQTTRSLPSFQPELFSCLPFDDLANKSQYILSNQAIMQTFVRYLFNGMWIMDMLQITARGSSSTSSPDDKHFRVYEFSEVPVSNFESAKMSEVEAFRALSREDIFFSSTCDVTKWDSFLNEFTSKAPSPTVHETILKTLNGTIHPTIAFLQENSPKGMDTVLLFTLALAMEIFCRSELFLHLSEQQWSNDSLQSVQWQDYVRVGRAQVARHVHQSSEKQLNDTINNSIGAPYTHGQDDIGGVSIQTVTLLDSLYVHLFLIHSQSEVLSYLSHDSYKWLNDLKHCIQDLPLQLSVYESSSAMNGYWRKFSRKAYHRESDHDEMKKACMDKYYILPDDSFSSHEMDMINYRLHTTTHPTFLLQSSTEYRQKSPEGTQYPVISVDTAQASSDSFIKGLQHAIAIDTTAESDAKFTMACLSPVQRCPLIIFDHKQNTFVERHHGVRGAGYVWDVQRVVNARISFASRALSSTQHAHNMFLVDMLSYNRDVSYLLSIILA